MPEEAESEAGVSLVTRRRAESSVVYVEAPGETQASRSGPTAAVGGAEGRDAGVGSSRLRFSAEPELDESEEEKDAAEPELDESEEERDGEGADEKIDERLARVPHKLETRAVRASQGMSESGDGVRRHSARSE